MPRPNKARSIHSEAGLARRVAYERDRRGMSLEGLAKRMTDLGCSIQGSAIYKIEAVSRRITVDELVAFSRVFDLPLDQLLMPPELVLKGEAKRLFDRWVESQDEVGSAVVRLNDRVQECAAAYAALIDFLRGAETEGYQQAADLLEELQKDRDQQDDSRMRETLRAFDRRQTEEAGT